MRRATMWLVALGACGGTAAPAALPAAEARGALTATMLARLGAAAGCPASRSMWCIASDGWSSGTTPDLPEGPRALVGVSIGLEKERPDAELLDAEVTLATLALREGRGLIGDLPPENASEQRMIEAAIASVGRVLTGETARVALAPAIVRYLESLPPMAEYPLAREEGAWRMRGKADARIRRVGRTWVAIELPGEGPEGIFVSIFVE